MLDDLRERASESDFLADEEPAFEYKDTESMCFSDQ